MDLQQLLTECAKRKASDLHLKAGSKPIVRIQGEVRAVFRHIPEGNPTFQDLYLPKVLERLGMERRGMILVTGITGSGKSTTLAAMIGFMNRSRNDHVLTIEDPIEYVHEDNK